MVLDLGLSAGRRKQFTAAWFFCSEGARTHVCCHCCARLRVWTPLDSPCIITHTVKPPAVSFENTLGKIAAQSLATPRPLIDFSGRREQAQGAGPTRRKVFKTIEAGYLLVLAIEDVDMEMLAVPVEAHPPLMQRRSTLVDQLVSLLNLPAGDQLLRLLLIPKAQRLLGRLAPLLAPPRVQTLAAFVLRHAPQIHSVAQHADDAESAQADMVAGLARAVSGSAMVGAILADCGDVHGLFATKVLPPFCFRARVHGRCLLSPSWLWPRERYRVCCRRTCPMTISPLH